RRVADAEEPTLAFGDHLEPHRRLLEPGIALLELTQRRPLGLADGLARRLDRQLGGHRRPAFFFRRTLRGGCGRDAAGAGLGASGPRRAPFPPPSLSSRGGVRDVRFSSTGAGVFGTRRRVINP